MVYLVGILGFVCGFLTGQALLLYLLRGYSKQDILALMKDRGQKFKYGLVNWSLAVLGALSFVHMYNIYLAGN